MKIQGTLVTGLEYRTPWGKDETLVVGTESAFKRFALYPCALDDWSPRRLSHQVHLHKPESYFVQSGSGTFRYGWKAEHEVEIATGDVLSVPVGVPHSAEASDDGLTVIEACGPQITDNIRIYDEYGRPTRDPEEVKRLVEATHGTAECRTIAKTIPEESSYDWGRFSLFATEGLHFGKLELIEGLPYFRNENLDAEQIFLVLQGRGTIETWKPHLVEHQLGPGDTVVVQPGVVHQIRPKGAFVLLQTARFDNLFADPGAPKRRSPSLSAAVDFAALKADRRPEGRRVFRASGRAYPIRRNCSESADMLGTTPYFPARDRFIEASMRAPRFSVTHKLDANLAWLLGRPPSF